MDWAGRKASRGGTAMSPQGCSCRHIYGEGTLLLCFINLRRAKIPSGQLEASLWQYINMHHGELANHRLLNSPKDRRTPFLFDILQPTPAIPPTYRLPHRTSSKVLPLVEGESRRPRQIASGSGSYRFRPP
ncbi:hypothetical protein GGS24DRAFT_289006 [Hypoxylon argillaceum]|nr:hypothetical protein GGS24DRAFT_289006 [Hypoxylon argillaceum]